MTRPDLNELTSRYERDGYLSPVPLISARTAATHRARLEDAEAAFGPLHYKTKVHTMLRSPFELVTDPQVLDIVAALIGPDILLYNVTYIIKEPGSAAHVSWHQDLTYWGLSHDDQVTMWLALSPATAQSGCMRMIPASHKAGRISHALTNDESNVLLQGQTVPGVSEDNAVSCPLQPGEASFHHGWTLHASGPNTGKDRRIGLNVQYLAPHVRQIKGTSDTALLVRGTDRYNHFANDIAATEDLAPAAVARQAALEARYLQLAGTS